MRVDKDASLRAERMVSDKAATERGVVVAIDKLNRVAAPYKSEMNMTKLRFCGAGTNRDMVDSRDV